MAVFLSAWFCKNLLSHEKIIGCFSASSYFFFLREYPVRLMARLTFLHFCDMFFTGSLAFFRP